MNPNIITIGSEVTLDIEGKEVVLKVTKFEDTKSGDNFVTPDSPVGKVLMDKRAGHTDLVTFPNGKEVRISVIRVR